MTMVWGFGSAAVDFRIITAELGEAYRDKLLAQSTQTLPGGALANALTQCARLGASCAYLGKLGDDPIGRAILASLQQEGIDTQHVRVDPTILSPMNVAAYAGPARRRIGGYLLPGSLAALRTEEAEAFAEKMRPGEWALAELGELSPSAVDAFLQAASARGVRTLLDVDLDPMAQIGLSVSEVWSLFRHAEILVPNAEAVRTLADAEKPGDIARALWQRSGRPTVVTAGGEGAYWSDKSGSHHMPALPVRQVVDPVGAGDAFHGGMLYALSQGATLRDAVALGIRCGAYNVGQWGARDGMLRNL